MIESALVMAAPVLVTIAWLALVVVVAAVVSRLLGAFLGR